MDLSQLDGWTRDALEAEARRIGIKGCEYRTRTELVRLLLRDRYGDRWNAGRETLARGVRGLSEVRAALGAAIERTIVSVLSLPDPREPAWGVPRGVQASGAREAEALRATVPNAPVASVAATDGVAARARTPDAPDASDSPEHIAAPPEAEDRVTWVCGQSDAALLRWHATAAGIRRARAVLGADGELALRVVVVAPDVREIVRTQVVVHGPVDAAGELPATPAIEGARRVAAVGLRAGERFVSIAHARA